jgi:hypothetical protein
MSASDVEAALTDRLALPLPLSVPPEGLALTAVRYPYRVEPDKD